MLLSLMLTRDNELFLLFGIAVLMISAIVIAIIVIVVKKIIQAYKNKNKEE